jgi:cell wall-associated NlpC family hydrolase
VDERAGSYVFDCSGMTAWVLSRAAPVAHRAVTAQAGRSRPLARDYYFHIAAVPTARPSRGWQRVARVADAQPGDVIAWVRPAVVRSSNTGHVAFVVAPPVPLEGTPGAWLVRIADASSYQHEDDTRAGTGRTGFGQGTILVLADEVTGAPRAYGWAGRYSAWVLETRIAIGRPVR